MKCGICVAALAVIFPEKHTAKLKWRRRFVCLAFHCSLDQALGKTGPACLTWSPGMTRSLTGWGKGCGYCVPSTRPNAGSCTWLRTTQSCLVGKDLGVLVTSSWTWARVYPGGQEPSGSLAFISNSVLSRIREVVTPCTWHWWGCTQSYVKFWGPLYKKGVEELKHVPRRATKLVRELEQKS